MSTSTDKEFCPHISLTGATQLLTTEAFALQEAVASAATAIRQARDLTETAYRAYVAWQRQVDSHRARAGGDPVLTDAARLSEAEFIRWLGAAACPEEQVKARVANLAEFELEVAETTSPAELRRKHGQAQALVEEDWS